MADASELKAKAADLKKLLKQIEQVVRPNKGGRPKLSDEHKELEGGRSKPLKKKKVVENPEAEKRFQEWHDEYLKNDRDGKKWPEPSQLSGYVPRREKGECWFDERAAWNAVNFFAHCLIHTKGYSGPFVLSSWESDIIATLFGWKRQDGTRRYREGFIAVPRKNGKTHLIAGVAAYCLEYDKEPSPEVICAAYSRDQASILFDAAASFVKASPVLSSKWDVINTTRRITNQDAWGFIRAIPAEVGGLHGHNPSAVLFDELHTQTSRDLYDVLKTSQGSRKQPLFLSITTAGYDRHSICHEVWKYAQQVRDGTIEDPYFLPVIYQIEEGDDWSDENVWKRVNPNLDVSISLEFLQSEFKRAKELPAYENTFRNLYLNQWTEQAERWFSLDSWDVCKSDIEPTYGAECYVGLDLSSTKDLSALALVFPHQSGVVVRCKFYVPSESARDRENRDRVPYRQWIKDGWITGTTGNTTDYDHIRFDLAELAKQYWIKTVAIDPWNANQLAHQLESDGLNVKFCGQGYGSLSGPSKELERLLLDNELFHDGNPVLRWCANNVSLKKDPAGNIKPDKSTSSERIDGLVAVIMGLGAMAEHTDTWKASEIGL